MKILIIHGSMRKGNTYALTKEVMNHLAKKQDVEMLEISVADLDLPFCMSCNACFQKGEEFCPHYKITKIVRDALVSCDGVVVSGPTYMWALNAAMKNLLDHFAYMFHRPELFGKYGIVVSTSAGAGEKGVAKYLKTVLGQWGINRALAVTRNAKEQALKSGDDARVESVVNSFCDNITTKKRLSPSIKNIAVHNSFRAMSLSRFGESEKDREFWSQGGYQDKAYPTEINPMKYAVGALVNGAVKRMSSIVGRSYKKEEKTG